MHRDAAHLKDRLFGEAGDTDHEIPEAGTISMQWRRAFTDADAGALKKRPIWETR